MSLRWISASLLLISLWVPTFAQDQDANVPELFRDEVLLEVVSIDVVVADRKGRLVEGLTAEDFELTVDGRQVEITNFYAMGEAPGRLSSDAAGPSPVGDTAQVPKNTEDDAVSPGAETTSVVVFFDNSRTAPGGRRRLLNDLPAFLETQTAAGRRVMVIAYDQGNAEILAPLTRDVDQLKDALVQVDNLKASGIQRRLEHRQVMDDVITIFNSCPTQNTGDDAEDTSSRCQCAPRMISRAEVYSAELDGQRAGSFASLDNVISALGALEGRKTFLYVSDGIEQQTALDVFHYIREICPDTSTSNRDMRLDGQAAFDSLVEHANANRVTFYSLEASGVQGFSSHSAAQGDESPFDVTGRASALNDQRRVANSQSGLFFMANETGGKAVLNANHFDEDLAKIDEETVGYYSLGYSPGYPAEGRSHRVAVRLPKHKKYELRYRRSFLHKDPDRQLAERALGAYLFGVERNPLGASVAAGTPAALTDGKVQVPIEVRVPLTELTFLPGEQKRQARLTLVVAAPGKNGRRTEIRKKELTIEAPLDAATSPPEYRVGVHVDLPPGDYELAVGLRDDIGETASFLKLPVSLASAAASPSGD